ncbi:peptidoglycan DD-metalloendopeptidase family protein [Patescibacteria group bacterium]
MRRLGLIAFALLFTILVEGKAKADPLVYLPFKYGEMWYCTQGQGGSFSHQGNQYYGFDFNLDSWQNSSANPAFGKNLYSPIDGQVVEIRDGVHDFTNNSASNASNNWGWGNTIVIKDEKGIYYVRLAHLKYGSVDHLNVGDWVDQGEYIGRVGQTGYSTNPHLHMQIMKTSMGSSKPFTFVEGKLYSYEWIRSKLIRRVSVVDNNDEVSLSNDFTTAYTYDYGYWQTMTGVDGYVGKNYYRHKVSSSYHYFKWRFSVKTSGYYAIYVTFPSSSSNDPAAKYYFGSTYLKTINQAQGNSFYRYLKVKYLSKYKNYSIKVKGTTTNKYVIADAIVLRKL